MGLVYLPTWKSHKHQPSLQVNIPVPWILWACSTCCLWFVGVDEWLWRSRCCFKLDTFLRNQATPTMNLRSKAAVGKTNGSGENRINGLNVFRYWGDGQIMKLRPSETRCWFDFFIYKMPLGIFLEGFALSKSIQIHQFLRICVLTASLLAKR